MQYLYLFGVIQGLLGIALAERQIQGRFMIVHIDWLGIEFVRMRHSFSC
jgi:hypothetical protein